ncbi:MAG: spermidine synthase [Halieaceae bacterium]
MNKWELLDTAAIPRNGGELRLLRRGDEFAIRIAGSQGDLMNSRTHGSEDALGALACARCKNAASAKVLVGGLGMGFTLAAALEVLHDNATVEVAELVPGVLKWNRELLGVCAGEPLNDNRVEVTVTDVGRIIERATGEYDAIILDVDNGPEGLTHPQNDDLYSLYGLEAAYNALRKSGVLSVWSATPVPRFTTILKKAGFKVEEHPVRAHNGKGAKHMVWLAFRD